jgi:putative NADH-flavin reductase
MTPTDDPAASPIKLRLALFGANGATGRLITERALAAGHTVTALLRDPAVFPYRDRVQVVHGSAFDLACVSDTIAGSHAVLSCLGASSLRREDVLERAVPVIVQAMEHTGPRRLIVLGSAGALPDSLDQQPAWRRWIVQKIVYNSLLKWPVASQIAQWKILSESTLDWTMVMPPMLNNQPPRHSFRVDLHSLPRNGSRISRADVADFMLAQLAPDGVRKGVYLSW